MQAGAAGWIVGPGSSCLRSQNRQTDSRSSESERSADRAVPVFKGALQLEHELAGVGAVDEAVIEAEAVVLHGADGDGVVAFGIGEDDRLFAQAADREDGGLRLVDDGRAEFAAKDAWVGEGEGGSANFVGHELLGARAAGEIVDGAGKRNEVARFGFANDGNDQSPLKRDGDAEMNVPVIADRTFFEGRIENREPAQGIDGCRGDERHVGELEAVALLEGGAFAVAEARDACHVDLVDGVRVGDGALALCHALGNDGTHPGHRGQLVLEQLRRGRLPLCGRLRRCRRIDVLQDVVFGDAAEGAGAGIASEIDVMFAGYAADQRRRTDDLRCDLRCYLGWGRLRLPALSCLCRGENLLLFVRPGGAAADDGDDRVDLHGFAFLRADLGESSVNVRRDLGVDLVGGDFEERLIDLNGIADLLEPSGDGALEDGFAHLGHDDFGDSAVSLSGPRSRLRWYLRWGRLSGGLLYGRGRRWFLPVRFRAAAVEHGDDGVDLDGRTLGELDFAQNAPDGRRNFGVDLVGGDLEERFVFLDRFAGLFEPSGDGAFEDRFAHLRHDDVGRHESFAPRCGTWRAAGSCRIINRHLRCGRLRHLRRATLWSRSSKVQARLGRSGTWSRRSTSGGI